MTQAGVEIIKVIVGGVFTLGAICLTYFLGKIRDVRSRQFETMPGFVE